MGSGSGRRFRGRALKLCAAVLGTVSMLAVPADATAGDEYSGNVSPMARLDLGGLGDIAFWGDLAAVSIGAGDDDAKNDGFALVDISEPERPRELSSFFCIASHYDVAIWQDLVFLAVDGSGSRPHGTSCKAEKYDGNGTFAGVRVISIRDPQSPQQVAAISTNGGSGAHTLSILPDLNHDAGPRVLVYSNGSSPETIVGVPLADPSDAKEVMSVSTLPAAGCHDVSFFEREALALCAGGPDATSVLWSIKEKANPKFVSVISNPAIENHHSAAFSWDGNTLIIGDENLHNFAIPEGRCAGGTPSAEGALWFYDITDEKAPVLKNRYQIPRKASRYCSAHQFNVVPLASDRDVLVSAWYTGGTTVVDFTELDDIKEVGFHRGNDASNTDRSNLWSSYWYNGHIYATNNPGTSLVGEVESVSERSLDVLKVKDSLFDHAIRLDHYNFGLQQDIRRLNP